jgi:uncharacterized protein (TIGR02001 family)
LLDALRLMAIGAGLTCALPASADGSFGGSLGVTSDYVSYGLSQTRGAAVMQGDAHYQRPLGPGNAGLFAGVFASTLNRDYWNDASYELDAYLGGTWRINEGSSATLTYTHYAYPDDSGRRNYDYNELALTWAALNERLFATLVWSPDTVNYPVRRSPRCCRQAAYEISLHQPLPYQLTVAAGAGYSELAGTTVGYGYWNTGLSRMLGDVELNLSYIGTQERAEYLFSEDVAGSRWVASAVWRFGKR